MGLARPIEAYESVATWSSGLRDQWGGDPLAEDAEKLSSLAAFCELIGKDPTNVVCLEDCHGRRLYPSGSFSKVRTPTSLDIDGAKGTLQ